MATEQVTICDRCGAQHDGDGDGHATDRGWLRIRRRAQLPRRGRRRGQTDLCPTCVVAFDAWLEAGPDGGSGVRARPRPGPGTSGQPAYVR